MIRMPIPTGASPLLTLAILLPLLLSSCGGGHKTEETAGDLENRLTDALSFDGGTPRDGAPPQGNAGTDAPQIEEVQAFDLQLGQPFTIRLLSGFEAPDTVDLAFVHVQGADRYLEVEGDLADGRLVLTGRVSSDKNLANEVFDLRFALHAEGDKTGVYKSLRLTVRQDAGENACGKEDCVVAGEFPGTERTDEFGIRWIGAPEGCVCMGCSLDDPACRDNEFEPHTVKLDAFEITVTEITQGQFTAVTGSTDRRVDCAEEDCPQNRVGWEEAKTFCESIGGRLPSESEWEYAARAGTVTRSYCGAEASCLDQVAWYDDGTGGFEFMPVGQKLPNAFGLYDMLGSLEEYVQDCYHDSYAKAPAGGKAWEDDECNLRMVRGGSLASTADGLRSSQRAPENDFDAFVGFRCVRDNAR